MTRHHPDLGSTFDWLKREGISFQPIRSTTLMWVVTRDQYAISALVTQTSFCEGSIWRPRETSAVFSGYVTEKLSQQIAVTTILDTLVGSIPSSCPLDVGVRDFLAEWR